MIFIKITLTLLFSIAVANASQIQLLSEDWSPYQIKDTASGVSYDIVKEIQKKVGNTKKIKFYPWNRGYNMTMKKNGFALFSTGKTKEREKLFKWVGPLIDLKLVFYKLKSNTKIYSNLEDAKKAKSIAVTKNDASQQVLDSLGFKNLIVKAGGSSQTNLKRLLNSKAELWPSDRYAGHHRIKQLEVVDKVVVTKVPSYLSVPLSIAFNKNTDDKIIEKWQKALDEMKADGTYEKILNRYK